MISEINYFGVGIKTQFLSPWVPMASIQKYFPQLSPITLRRFTEMRLRLATGEAAIFIGAGVDMQLGGTPGWGRLLTALLERTPQYREQAFKDHDFGYITKSFPAEAAYLARWNLGDRRFSKLLSKKINGHLISYTDRYLTGLSQLLDSCNLIVTTNYSHYLKTIIQDKFPNKKLIVRDREELSTFNFPQPERNSQNQEIYLVHLHGRCSEHSFPILDAWGYNVAREDSEEYMYFLRRLFRERHVLVIGSSLQDIPFRDAVAYVKRKTLYSNKGHLAIYYDAPRPKELEVALKNSIRGSLGLELFHVTKNNQAEALCGLKPLNLYRSATNISGIADFFDETGDYDSELQHSWLKKHSRSKNTSAPIYGIRKLLDEMHRSLILLIANGRGASWVSAAKLEKHLRHHRYLYFGAADLKRKQLWLKLAMHSSAEKELLDQSERFRFDFLVAMFELKIKEKKSLPAKVYKKLSDLDASIVNSFELSSSYRERLTLAADVWNDNLRAEYLDRPTAQTLRVFEVLQDRLLNAGWESMAAKICGDKIALQAQIANRITKKKHSYQIINRILDDADRAEGLARQAGSFWRNFKPSVLRACWSSNTEQARLDLLGKIHAAKVVANPMLLSALVAGLIVCELKLRTRIVQRMKVGQMYSYLCDMLKESDLSENFVSAALNGYWSPLVPSNVFAALKKLEEMSRRSGGGIQ